MTKSQETKRSRNKQKRKLFYQNKRNETKQTNYPNKISWVDKKRRADN